MLKTRTKIWIGIGVLVFLILFAIVSRMVDTKRVEAGQKPMFCLQMATVADGGSKIYIGLGYKVVEYQQKEGYQGMVIGGWNLEYDSDYEVNQFPIITAEVKSPNGETIENEKEQVIYAVSVHQKDENTLLVKASSNTSFFENMQYEVETNAKITKKDIQIQWTTLMGNPEASQEDQFAIAVVTITKDGEEIDKRKINFVGKAIETVVEVIKK